MIRSLACFVMGGWLLVATATADEVEKDVDVRVDDLQTVGVAAIA